MAVTIAKLAVNDDEQSARGFRSPESNPHHVQAVQHLVPHIGGDAHVGGPHPCVGENAWRLVLHLSMQKLNHIILSLPEGTQHNLFARTDSSKTNEYQGGRKGWSIAATSKLGSKRLRIAMSPLDRDVPITPAQKPTSPNTTPCQHCRRTFDMLKLVAAEHGTIYCSTSNVYAAGR